MKLSPQYQTSTCAALYRAAINFASKSTVFTCKGMLARYSKIVLLINTKDSLYFSQTPYKWHPKISFIQRSTVVTLFLSHTHYAIGGEEI